MVQGLRLRMDRMRGKAAGPRKASGMQWKCCGLLLPHREVVLACFQIWEMLTHKEKKLHETNQEHLISGMFNHISFS